MNDTNDHLWRPILPAYERGIRVAFGIDLVVLLLAALTLDHGKMFRNALAALFVHMAIIARFLVRRPVAPTRTDLLLIRYGMIPAYVLVAVGMVVVTEIYRFYFGVEPPWRTRVPPLP